MNPVTRRSFLGSTGVAVLAGATLSRAAFGAETPRPNILFILADDHRADAIGALGHPTVRTPNLDRLVERGMTFRRAYVMGSDRGAVCLPSRCMVMTGRTLFRLAPLGVWAAAAGKGEARVASASEAPALMPRTFGAAGYETFRIGKRGNECAPAIAAFEHSIVRDDHGEEERRGSSQAHADAVIAFLRERKRDRPFFVQMAPPVPHDPRVAPKEFAELYDPAKIPLPAAYAPVHPFDNGEMTVRDEKLAPWPRTPEIVRRHLADYYACVTCLDHHIGRVVACLEELGQLGNTIIVFAGDNGLSLGEHGLFGKQNLYEFGGMHVPLVVAGPGIRPGRSEAFVYLLDLFPTFCELAGVPVPASVEGRSLAGVLAGRGGLGREALFTAYRDGQRAVRTERWKLIRYPLIGRSQLFDLDTDPHELKDLAGDPAMAGRLREMTELLERMQKEFGDPKPLTVPAPQPAEWTPPGDAMPAGGKARAKKARK